MTENSTLLLALVSATLIALDRQLRTGTWPTWLKIPGWGRALIVILVGVLSAAVESWLGGGGTFIHSLLVAGGVAVPALVTLLLHPEQAKSAAVLVLMVCGLGQTGCAMSLGEAQKASVANRMGVSPDRVGFIPSAACQALDEKHSDWLAAQYTLEAWAGPAGVGAIFVPDDYRYETEVRIALGASGGLAAVGAIYAGTKAAHYRELWVEQCTQPGGGQ
jgi:hypothetical protein